MNKLLLTIGLVIACNSITAQTNAFNVISLETGIGATIPISPNDNLEKSKFLALKQFNMGGRYMFTKSFGLKGSYQFNGFRSKENSNKGIDYHSLRLEAVYNVGRLFQMPHRFQENFALLTHIGLGYSRGKPVGENFSEQTGNIQWGLTPLFKLNNTIALNADLTYVFNLKQHYTYNGSLISESYDDVTGGYMTLGVGVIIYIGEERRHVDWL